jgi:YHS domain-containing protein
MILVTAALLSLTPAVDDVSYAKDVHPILAENCFKCHGSKKQKGGVRLDMKAGLFEGDEGFIPVVPGDPDGSLLLEVCELPEDDPDLMPEGGPRLSEQALGTLRAWIEQGASWEAVMTEDEAEQRLVLPGLTAEQEAARAQALERVGAAGAIVLPVARDLHALDANLSLLRAAAGDDALAAMAGLEPSLVWLNLSGTAVTDAGLASLAGFKELRRLNLSRTAVTAAGLTHLAAMEQLEVLNLYGSQVGDEAVAAIAALKGLKRIYLWESAFSEEGFTALAKACPELGIDRGLAPVVDATPPVAGAVNETCPVSGSAVDGTIVTVYDSQPIAFCCKDCKAKFEADPAAYAGNLPGARPAAVNSKCPISGADVDASVTSTFEGQAVAFCCAKCKAAFDAEPAKFADKLPKAKAAAVNAKCPVSGGDVDAAVTSAFEGQTVAFCCGKCKAAFDAEPAKFADKLPKAKTAAVNAKCPVGGGDVDAAVTSAFEGRTVAFCCGKCKAAFDAEPAKFASKLKG